MLELKKVADWATHKQTHAGKLQSRLHLRINGSPFDLTGVARPFDKVPSSTLRVAFTGLQLEKWADVWPMPLPFKLERALLDSNLQIVFEQPKDQPGLHGHGHRPRDPGEPQRGNAL
ncbi:hypothetical protein [Lactiplantibacillus plantarum]|uniref:hypothetical protein n=1 Tax=Lactiplantibacillus plantarum TaxID=1590 RepID=UPI0040457E64